MNTTGWLTLIITAALAGWMTGAMFGENVRTSTLTHTVVGFAGAVLGAIVFLLSIPTGERVFDIWGQVWALVGAMMLSGAARPLTHRHVHSRV